MMKRLIIFLLVTNISSCLAAQSDPASQLQSLFGRLVSSTDDQQKIQVNDSIKTIISSYIRSDSVFRHRFSNVRYLGQVVSSDSSIKIVTWNMNLSDEKGLYHCYIIRKLQGTDRMIYNLTSPYRPNNIRTDTTYISDNWYGALYYDLKPFIVNGRRCWVILGLDLGNPAITRKIIDVLNFRDDNSLYFGKKWFESEGKLSYRIVFGYASSGMMTLRFMTDNSVVFDHLVPLNPALAGDRRFYGPDYSYDAYTLKDGVWRFSLNVDARNKE